MAKVKVTIMHRETGDIDLGDIPEGMFAASLFKAENWSFGDVARTLDWETTEIRIGNKTYLSDKVEL